MIAAHLPWPASGLLALASGSRVLVVAWLVALLFLPALSRAAARHAGRWVGRRLLPRPPRRRSEANPQGAKPEETTHPQQSRAAVHWLAGAVAAGAGAMLLWWLLHAR